MSDKTVYIFRDEYGHSMSWREDLRKCLLKQLEVGNVLIVPRDVSLIDIREDDGGNHEIGYV